MTSSFSRRHALGLLAAPLAVPLFSHAASAATLEEIKKRGFMIVATEDDFRPFEFV
jgi:polar amino acid transport system substrate-binding protein